MSKLVVAIGMATLGARRVSESAETLGVWVRIAKGQHDLQSEFERCGIRWAQPKEARKSQTVLFSLAASFDADADGVYEWQRKEKDGSLYIEVPAEYAPADIFNLVDGKERGYSLKREVLLYKSGVLQVRS